MGRRKRRTKGKRSSRKDRAPSPGTAAGLAVGAGPSVRAMEGQKPVPDHVAAAGATVDEAMALHRAGDLEGAIARYSEALVVLPAYAELHNNLGAALLDLGSPIEAIEPLRRAVALRPDLTAAHKNLGDGLSRAGRWEDAVQAYTNALSADPDNAGALLGLGLALRSLGRHEDASVIFDGARALAPDLLELDYQLGLTQRELGRWPEAAQSFGRVVSAGAGDLEVRRLYAGALLTAGNFEAGLEELAMVIEKGGVHARTSRLPRWRGEDVRGKRLLLWSDRGFGDAIMMARYGKLACEAGARICLDVPRSLASLFEACEWVDEVGSNRDDWEADFQLPMGLLPALFKTRTDSIPAWERYLGVSGPPQLEPRRNGLAVGLVWGGSPFQANDVHRSVPLWMLAPLCRVPGVQFFSLQVGPAREQLALQPWAFQVVDWGGRVTDFRDTARLIEGLDLVITVDTAVAHLTGAIGVPVWVLLPRRSEWFWLADRSDSPWYPSATLFRQANPGDWAPVVERVCDTLRSEVRKRFSA